MPSTRIECIQRVKSVEREYTAVRFAMDFFLDSAKINSDILGRSLRVRDLEESITRLEDTYVIRLFAEFEAALRAYWFVSRNSIPPSRTRDLLDGIGAKRRIPIDAILNAHNVRDFRNSLVHQSHETTRRIAIDQSRRFLCIFMAFLPMSW